MEVTIKETVFVMEAVMGTERKKGKRRRKRKEFMLMSDEQS